MIGDVGGRGIFVMEPHLLTGRELPECQALQWQCRLQLSAFFLSQRRDWTLAPFPHSGHLPHFPKLGSVFVPIWKCSHRGAKSGREAPQDSRQLHSPG